MTTRPDLAGLAKLDRVGLVNLWFDLFGTPVPKSLSRPLACRALAFELQTRAQGGLPSGFRARLAAAASPEAVAPAPRLKPGGRLLREWGGVTHVVEVGDDVFHWRGKPWRSLSAIAREITGARWSGPRFFGLTDGEGAGSRPARPAASKTKMAARR